MATLDLARSPFDSYLAEILAEFAADDDGEVATYIPELGRADPARFSICLCTTDGHIYAVGDSTLEFTIQSVSKPFVYGMALEDRGRDEVLSRVGVEPSGNPFNAILVDDTNRPFNPMVNAGAIVTTAMVEPEARIRETLGRFAGRDLTVDESIYESERAAGDRNRAIAFLMRSFGVIDGDADAAVDRYFRQCAIAVTCRDLAVMAATLANRGRNPVTDVQALDEPYIESVLSVMGSCGMYDASGEWMFRVGLPAKSGVAGGLVAVLPGQFGIGVFSPRLDPKGNSTRGIRVCERIATDFNLHPMRFHPDVRGVVRRSYTCADVRSSRLRSGAEINVLEEFGDTVRIFELQGDLHFGTAERVFREVIRMQDGLDIVVLDCKRVIRADDVARRMFDQLRDALAVNECSLVLADAEGEPDGDTVLERCEDRVLERFGTSVLHTTVDLGSQELLRDLTAEELATVTDSVVTHHLAPGDVLFKHADPADSVFFIVTGALTVQLPHDDAGGDQRSRRLARLGAGVAVGEMALVDDAGRSADVVAAEDAEVAELSMKALGACSALHPGLATKIHLKLAGILAARLRNANEQLRHRG